MKTVFLTTQEVSERTGKTVRWIQKLIKDGRLPVKETVNGYLIKETDVSIVLTLPKVGRPRKEGKENK